MIERDGDEARVFSRLSRSYSFALKWSRLTAAGFAVMAVIFGVWVTPWMRVGMRPQDYNGKVVFTLLLLTTAFALASLSLLLRGIAARRRQALAAWNAVFDEATGLHNRRFFTDRLALECERGDHIGFALLLFRFEVVEREGAAGRRPRPDVLRAAGHLLAREARSSDVVAVMSGTDLAVLATPVAGHFHAPMLERLERVLALELIRAQQWEQKGRLAIRAGLAAYGADGTDPSQLLSAARDNLKPLHLPAEANEPAA